MKAQIFIMEDDEFYFEEIKKVLKKTSLTFYPSSKEEFYQLRGLLCTATFLSMDSITKDSKKEILQILEKNANNETTFLVACCLGESQYPTLEGLTLYEMFTKGCGKKTIIISNTRISEEIEKIESFCKENDNCFLFRKSKKSIQKKLVNYL